jgi:flagella basal body P-ring formation protein FlgA
LQRGAAVGLVGHRIETFQTIDEVVGLETTRAITAGQPFDAKLLRPRLMVHRGDVVTVYARTAGVEVRTFARARDDGSLGDFVSLQRLTKGRQELRARVTGEREVDVLAQSTTVAPVGKRP